MRARRCKRLQMSEPADWAEETEARLLNAMIAHAPRQGWSHRAIAAAARDIGLAVAEAELLTPHGPRDLAALMARHHDRRALETLSQLDPRSLKVRERIRLGVLARCDVAIEDEPATRRWMGFLVLPPNVPLALRLTWASADTIWRWAGDVATDENHYSKRALLAEILISTLAIRLATGGSDAATHLDARIEAVMSFERWKSGLRPSEVVDGLAGRLGRLRYGSA
jgi:ubiquinone biosynthesis protein COQ9